MDRIPDLGDWVIAEDSTGGHYSLFVNSYRGKTNKKLMDIINTNDNFEANARLISYAPALLNILNVIISEFYAKGNMDLVIEQACDIIDRFEEDDDDNENTTELENRVDSVEEKLEDLIKQVDSIRRQMSNLK